MMRMGGHGGDGLAREFAGQMPGMIFACVLGIPLLAMAAGASDGSITVVASPGAWKSPADAAAADRTRAYPRESPFVARPFQPFPGERWIGDAVAYGPHRDGQFPGGPGPSRAELHEDLQLIVRHWRVLRIYSSAGWPDTLLQIIRDDHLGLKVVLGVWLAPEERRDSTGRVVERIHEAQAANRREVEAALRLASEYPGTVVAVSAGNETQVFWSDHTLPAAVLVGYLRELRARARVPVTTADDFAYWKAPESREVAAEVDFILLHLHPLWNGRSLEGAVPWIERTFADVRRAHPGIPVVIGETGWATQRSNEGEQARLMKGATGEAEQAAFYRAFRAWAHADRVTAFMFEAFDEKWKGGTAPDEVEKHWGLYRADRTPKPALQSGN